MERDIHFGGFSHGRRDMIHQIKASEARLNVHPLVPIEPGAENKKQPEDLDYLIYEPSMRGIGINLRNAGEWFREESAHYGMADFVNVKWPRKQ